MKTKEELQREMSAARKAIDKIENAEREEKAKRIIGTYWKYRNSYSCAEKPSDYWFLYLTVVRSDGNGMLQTFRFETDSHGDIKTHVCEWQFPHSITDGNYVQIREHEFETAWKKMLKHLEKVKP